MNACEFVVRESFDDALTKFRNCSGTNCILRHFPGAGNATASHFAPPLRIKVDDRTSLSPRSCPIRAVPACQPKELGSRMPNKNGRDAGPGHPGEFIRTAPLRRPPGRIADHAVGADPAAGAARRGAPRCASTARRRCRGRRRLGVTGARRGHSLPAHGDHRIQSGAP